MIARDRNHPCVFSWGLCNEVDGQNPVAQEFVRRMLREAKSLDPGRLCSYASNSLQTTPERDVAGEMDFIEWNEYYESWFGGDVGTLRENLEAIHRAFPDKPIVISEYGYCACTADRPENDPRRIEILRTHNAVFRDCPWVAGLIFFDYNDYRTHIGDKGRGVLKQRVHGVVDVFGARKPSFEVLRRGIEPGRGARGAPGGRRPSGRRPDPQGPAVLHAQGLHAALDRLRDRGHPARAGRGRLSPSWRRARRRPSASRRRRRTSGPSSSRSCGRRASPPRRSAPERAGPLRPWAARLSARRGPAALPPCTGCRGRSGPRGPAPGPSSS